MRLSCVLASVFAAALANARAIAAEPSRPNIVVILADDLGYGDLGCYGHPRFKTQRLDRMAAEGVRFTQFNTPMPFCAPTRAALLTGRYPLRCGLMANPTPDAGPQADAVALPRTEVLLPELLKQAGYTTGMVGKWHLGHKEPASLPTRRGFDEYLGILYSNDMRPVRLLDGESVVEYPLVQATLTERYTDRAIQFITRNRNRPFFLYLAHATPHKPLACSEGYYKKSGTDLYGDVMAELDASVGRLLDALKKLDLDNRTLVIFTSDNGPWFGGSTGGLRGMKSTSWEGGYRVPFIVRWPGRLPEGKVHDGLGVTMDIFATALAAAGVKPPAGRMIDGKDLLPALDGRGANSHEAIFEHDAAGLVAVREARWKLHLRPASDLRVSRADEHWIDPRGPDGVTILAPYEQFQPAQYPGLRTGDETPALALFDLQSDPREQHNVASQRPDVVARLKQRADAWTDDLNANKAAPAKVEHAVVYRERGRFGGWPANHGIWCWGDEILVGFSRGYYKDRGPYHHIDKSKPEEYLLARSRDGGATWSIEEPQPPGALLGTLGMRHGIMPDGKTDEVLLELREPINFTHPDFAMTVRMEETNKGTSRFYYSYNRGHAWRGPYRLPLFGQKGVMARTDYLVNGPGDCTLFLTASKSNSKEGRPFCARTTDGGLTWNFVSFIGPEPIGYAIMPSTVRVSSNELVTMIRRLDPPKSWIDAFSSPDNGRSWTFLSTPEPDTGEGNPPSLLRLRDGRLALIYGRRAVPFGIRARLSADHGKTWSGPIVIREDAGGRDIGYVRSVLRRDGKVVAVYYYHEQSDPTRFIAATIWDPGK